MTFIRGYGLKANTKKQLLTLLIYDIKFFLQTGRKPRIRLCNFPGINPEVNDRKKVLFVPGINTSK